MGTFTMNRAEVYNLCITEIKFFMMIHEFPKTTVVIHTRLSLTHESMDNDQYLRPW